MDFTKPLVHGSFMFYFVIFAFPISHLSNKNKKKNSCTTFSLHFGGSFISVPCRPGISFLCYIVAVVRFPVKSVISWKEPPFLTLYVSHTKSLKLHNSCSW